MTEYELAPRHARAGKKKIHGSVITLIVVVAFIAGFFTPNIITYSQGWWGASTSTPTGSPTSSSPQETTATDDLVDAQGAPIPLTPPGSALSLGQSAKVSIDLTAQDKAAVEIALTNVRKATDAELLALTKAVPQLDGMDIYFSDYALTKLAGPALAGFDVVPLLMSLDSAGNAVQSLHISNWKKCAQGPLAEDIDTVGTVNKVCIAAAAPKGTQVVVGGEYSQSSSAYDGSINGEITWLPATSEAPALPAG